MVNQWYLNINIIALTSGDMKSNSFLKEILFLWKYKQLNQSNGPVQSWLIKGQIC